MECVAAKNAADQWEWKALLGERGEKRYSQGGERKVGAGAEAVNSVGPAEVLWHVEFCLEGEPIERSCACQEPSTLAHSGPLQFHPLC